MTKMHDFPGLLMSEQKWSTGSRAGSAADAAGKRQWIARSSSYSRGSAYVSCSCKENVLYTAQSLDCLLYYGEFNLEYKEAWHEGIHWYNRL